MPTESTLPRAAVLLVDDSPANLTALVAVLEPLDLRLHCAESGAAALALAEQHALAVAIVDVRMPIMDGFETARRLHELPGRAVLPILFLTATLNDEQNARQAYRYGADYIVKPFDPEMLRARIQSYVDLFIQREETQRALADRSLNELREVQKRLEAFEQIATAAVETEDLDTFLHSLLRVVVHATDSADGATIMLRKESTLIARASIGPQGDMGDATEVPIGHGFPGQVAATGRAQLLVREDLLGTVQGAWLHQRGLRALYVVPLAHDGEVIGVAYIGSTEARAFVDADMRLFRAMADRAARVVSRKYARQRLHDVLDAAPVAITIFRPPDYVCEFANTASCNAYGGRSVVGMSSIAMGATAEMLSLFERVIERGETTSFDEYAVETDWDGGGAVSRRFFQLSLHPLRDGLGRPESVLVIGIDLTVQVNSRQALEASERDRERLLELERAARKDAESANRMKDDFLATVSHELRTPLNAILGWTSNARRGIVSDLDRALAVIERSARAQARIIDDVLDMSRIVSGRMRLDIDSVAIAPVLLGAADAVRPAAEGKGIVLRIELAADLGVVAVDRDRIQQVVWNLLSNAVKFTPPGGAVHFSAWREPDKVVVRVTDTGQGIEPVFLPHVFEPFRQEDASPSRRHGGVGLGLAIARQLVLAHGGTLSAASDGPGHGATFVLELPTHAVPAVAGRNRPGSGGRRLRKASSSATHRLEGLRVLVVDDESDSRELVGRVLEHHGADVRLARSAGQALEEVGLFHPNVIVSDIGMPGTDGYTLLRELRARPIEMGGTIPAIALTAYASSEDRQRATLAGYQDHIAKPVDPADLISRIADLGGRARLS